MNCDTCNKPIVNLDAALISWRAEERGNHLTAHELHVAHKGACDDRKRRPYSIECYWFAHPSAAVWRLGEMVRTYHWTIEQIDRLRSFVDDIPPLSTAAQREGSMSVLYMWGSLPERNSTAGVMWGSLTERNSTAGVE